MNKIDLLVFKESLKRSSPKQVQESIKDSYNLDIGYKTIYTSVKRLLNLGFIEKEESGKNIQIFQASTPVATYLTNLLDNYPHYINKDIFKNTSLKIQVCLLHNHLSAKSIAELVGISLRTTKRYLSKLHNLAIIKRMPNIESSNEHMWEINKINDELVTFLESYEEFKALKIIQKVDKESSILWINGIEFLIKTKKNIDNPSFKKTGASVLENYGLKLIAAENYFFYTKRDLDIWDHAFLMVLSRKNDPTQLRYLAFLYYTTDVNRDEFIKKGRYYNRNAMQKVINLFENNQETRDLKMKYIEELKQLYGAE